MAQVAELDARLAQVPGLTAALLGLGGARVRPGSAGPLPQAALLTHVTWDGAPAFPDLHGVFVGPGGERRVVDLHTDALRTLSRLLGLRQTWGLGPARPGS